MRADSRLPLMLTAPYLVLKPYAVPVARQDESFINSYTFLS